MRDGFGSVQPSTPKEYVLYYPILEFSFVDYSSSSLLLVSLEDEEESSSDDSEVKE
jgi:hypothetical protein